MVRRCRCPGCGEIITMELPIPTLVFDEYPIDSNEVNQWSCVWCNYSDSFNVWSLGMFAGQPGGQLTVCDPVSEVAQGTLF